MRNIVGIGIEGICWELLQELMGVSQKKSFMFHHIDESKLHPSNLFSIAHQVIELEPEVIFISPRSFHSHSDCWTLLHELPSGVNGDTPQLGLLLHQFEEELQPIITYLAQIELTNKMKFIVSDSSLFLSSPLKRFPRMQIDDELELQYRDHSGRIVSLQVVQLPLYHLIPISAIQKISKNGLTTSTEEWILASIEEQEKPIELSQIRSIFRDSQECYFFPGIPMNQVENMKVGNVEIHYLLTKEDLEKKSLNLKRLRSKLKGKSVEKSKLMERQPLVSHISSIPLLIHLLEKIFDHEGINNVHLEQVNHPLASERLLEMKFVDEHQGEANRLNWEADLAEMIRPLQFWVNLEECFLPEELPSGSISKSELIKRKEKLQKQEKYWKREQQVAKSRELILFQEVEGLEKVHECAKEILPLFSKFVAWEEFVIHPAIQSGEQLLLFTEDQEEASLMMQKFPEIRKKLWLDSRLIEDENQLAGIKISVIQEYLENGTVAITKTSLEHLQRICRQVLKRYQEEQKLYEKNQKYQEKIKNSVAEIHKQQEELVLQWVSVHLRRLVSRDRERFI